MNSAKNWSIRDWSTESFPVGDWVLQLHQGLIKQGLGDLDPYLLLSVAVSLFLVYCSLRAGRKARTELARLGEENASLRAKVSELELGIGSAEGIDLEDSISTRLSTPVVVDEVASEPKTVLSGLSKTRGRFFSGLAKLFTSTDSIDSSALSELEELLIGSDLGVKTTKKLLDAVREQVNGSELTAESLRENLKKSITEILHDDARAEIVPEKRDGLPQIIVVVGVNGVGKTTTIGKLARQFSDQGAKVLLAACDTFRAAAVDQLEAWGQRVGVGVDVVTGDENAKPSTIAYQAVHRARDESYDVLIVDTAGRLHTRVNLMNELSNVIKIITREQAGSPHETILVLDASTGQNALQQAREFNQKAGLSGIVVTKLDGTPKGGIVVAVKDELRVPIRYVGVGEGVEDLKVFSATEFVSALFSETDDFASADLPSTGKELGSGDGEKKPQVKRKRRRAHE